MERSRVKMKATVILFLVLYVKAAPRTARDVFENSTPDFLATTSHIEDTTIYSDYKPLKNESDDREDSKINNIVYEYTTELNLNIEPHEKKNVSENLLINAVKSSASIVSNINGVDDYSISFIKPDSSEIRQLRVIPIVKAAKTIVESPKTTTDSFLRTTNEIPNELSTESTTQHFIYTTTPEAITEQQFNFITTQANIISEQIDYYSTTVKDDGSIQHHTRELEIEPAATVSPIKNYDLPHHKITLSEEPTDTPLLLTDISNTTVIVDSVELSEMTEKFNEFAVTTEKSIDPVITPDNTPIQYVNIINNDSKKETKSIQFNNDDSKIYNIITTTRNYVSPFTTTESNVNIIDTTTTVRPNFRVRGTSKFKFGASESSTKRRESSENDSKENYPDLDKFKKRVEEVSKRFQSHSIPSVKERETFPPIVKQLLTEFMTKKKLNSATPSSNEAKEFNDDDSSTITNEEPINPTRRPGLRYTTIERNQSKLETTTKIAQYSVNEDISENINGANREFFEKSKYVTTTEFDKTNIYKNYNTIVRKTPNVFVVATTVPSIVEPTTITSPLKPRLSLYSNNAFRTVKKPDDDIVTTTAESLNELAKQQGNLNNDEIKISNTIRSNSAYVKNSEESVPVRITTTTPSTVGEKQQIDVANRGKQKFIPSKFDTISAFITDSNVNKLYTGIDNTVSLGNSQRGDIETNRGNLNFKTSKFNRTTTQIQSGGSSSQRIAGIEYTTLRNRAESSSTYGGASGDSKSDRSKFVKNRHEIASTISTDAAKFRDDGNSENPTSHKTSGSTTGGSGINYGIVDNHGYQSKNQNRATTTVYPNLAENANSLTTLLLGKQISVQNSGSDSQRIVKNVGVHNLINGILSNQGLDKSDEDSNIITAENNRNIFTENNTKKPSELFLSGSYKIQSGNSSVLTITDYKNNPKLTDDTRELKYSQTFDISTERIPKRISPSISSNVYRGESINRVSSTGRPIVRENKYNYESFNYDNEVNSDVKKHRFNNQSRGSVKFKWDPKNPEWIYDDDDADFPSQFSYNYQTANGISASQKGVLKAIDNKKVFVITGSYQYISPDGTPIFVTYTADEHGFHPKITSPSELKSLEIYGLDSEEFSSVESYEVDGFKL